MCYYNLSKLDDAKKYFKLCKNINNDFNINKNIALLELSRDKISKFLKYCKEALTIQFDCFLANLVAEKLELLGHYHEAIGLYTSVINIEPTNINCLNNLGNLYQLLISQVDDIDKAIDDTYGKSLKQAIINKETRKTELILSNIIFNNLYNWNFSEQEIFNRVCKWSEYFPKEDNLINIVSKLDRTKRSDKKIRIGYISTDFLTHPVGFMFDSILKKHNMDQFEIFCYDNSSKGVTDITGIKLRSYNNAKWYQIDTLNDEQILEILVNDNLDILVDMMGHTRNTRMNILQYKPARIIISYFAYPSTNGLKEIDYKFSDKYATPPETQQYFTEKLYYLPNGFQCYTPPQDLVATKTYDRSKYKIHLCCFNNPIKLSIPTIKVFSEILKQLPESKLFLRYCYYKSSYYKESIIRLFVKNGVERERIDAGFEPLTIALNSYNNMDIALDPFPYNGGTISSEALYMNTPFITLAGTNYVSRVGISLLSNLGLEKYIATTHEEYIQKVVDLARNESELKELHQSLRLRMLQTDLANPTTFTQHIEEAYIDMIAKY